MTFVEVKFECINWWGNEVYRTKNDTPILRHKIQVMRKALTGMNVECAGGVYRLLVPKRLYKKYKVFVLKMLLLNLIVKRM